MESVQLKDYCFPIESQPVFTGNDKTRATHYKSIYRADTGSLLSIVGKDYKIMTNEELLDTLLGTIEKVGYKYYLDPSHSFVQDNRMRLQVTLPELTLQDDQSKIPLSLFVHNSYDYSEGVRIFWGAIRLICSNGMVFGKVLQKFYSKHTKGLEIETIKMKFEKAYQTIPEINQRIKLLENEVPEKDIEKELIEQLGPKIAKEINLKEKISNGISAWVLYNFYTNYISHIIKIQTRAQYQQKLSKIFNL